MLMSPGPCKVQQHILNPPGAITVWVSIVRVLNASYWILLKWNQQTRVQRGLAEKHCGEQEYEAVRQSLLLGGLFAAQARSVWIVRCHKSNCQLLVAEVSALDAERWHLSSQVKQDSRSLKIGGACMTHRESLSQPGISSSRTPSFQSRPHSTGNLLINRDSTRLNFIVSKHELRVVAELWQSSDNSRK